MVIFLYKIKNICKYRVCTLYSVELVFHYDIASYNNKRATKQFQFCYEILLSLAISLIYLLVFYAANTFCTQPVSQVNSVMVFNSAWGWWTQTCVNGASMGYGVNVKNLTCQASSTWNYGTCASMQIVF